jgi:hypothetical protein
MTIVEAEEDRRPFVKSRTASKDRAGNRRLQGHEGDEVETEMRSEKSRTASRCQHYKTFFLRC